MILPRIQAYATPIIDGITMISRGKKKSLTKYKEVGLDTEITRALRFLQSMFELDPKVHINTFLNLREIFEIPLWSDASGYNTVYTPMADRSNNPTPGTCASLFFSAYGRQVFNFARATA